MTDIISGANDVQGTLTKFNDVLNDCNLFDTWRLFNPDIKEYTWSKRNPFAAKRFGLYFHRFPRVCVFFLDKTRECNIISVPMSDHRGCDIVILLSEVVKGQGHWKFNNSLFEDINQMNEVIDSFVTDDNTASQDQQSWELLKLRIKQFSIRYSRQKNLERKNELLNLQKELTILTLRSVRLQVGQ